MANKKTHDIHIRCTELEKRIILNRAKTLDLSLSEYLLVHGMGKNLKLSPKKVLAVLNKIITDDSKLENNINQIAKNLNANITTFDDKNIEDIVKMLSLVTQKREILFKEVNNIYRVLSKNDS